MPFSSCSPRSSNWRPEPATRSLVVALTRISPGTRDRHDPRADMNGDATRLLAGTAARPRPYGRPPGPRARAERATPRSPSPQRIARAGPSNRAKNPSPAVSTSSPEKRANSRRTASSCSWSRSDQEASPSSPALAVEPTRSVKSTVARTRSDLERGARPSGTPRPRREVGPCRSTGHGRRRETRQIAHPGMCSAM